MEEAKEKGSIWKPIIAIVIVTIIILVSLYLFDYNQDRTGPGIITLSLVMENTNYIQLKVNEISNSCAAPLDWINVMIYCQNNSGGSGDLFVLSDNAFYYNNITKVTYIDNNNNSYLDVDDMFIIEKKDFTSIEIEFLINGYPKGIYQWP